MKTLKLNPSFEQAENRKMLKSGDFYGCREISQDEQIKIKGGEGPVYWFGYAIGKGLKAISDALSGDCTCK